MRDLGYQLLAEAAQQHQASWPETIVLIALFILIGFIAWCWMRG